MHFNTCRSDILTAGSGQAKLNLSLKTKKMEKFNRLNRTEMRKVTGGNFAACTAKCGVDAKGHDITVTCTGDKCTAKDYDGCTGTDGNQSCGVAA